ncbi:MAG: hypothetical protein K2O42_07855, partial [Oscillospiraceae bacterium]|nr:hypothetical protein [Oscillospiraceae bacterium]
MKKCSSRLAALAVSALSFSNLIAFAENSENFGNPEIISGTWGNLAYEIRDHVLTVSGEGEIYTDAWFAD